MYRSAYLRPVFFLGWSLAFTAMLGAAEPAGSHSGEAPAPVDAVAAASPDQLLGKLPKVAEISRHGDQVVWQSAGISITVLDTVADDLVVDSVIGRLVVPRRLVAERRIATLEQLPALAGSAKAAGLSGGGFSLQEGLLTGPSLRSEEVMVVAQGVLRKQPMSQADRGVEVVQITKAAQRLRAALGTTGLDAIGQRALDDVLQRLDRRDGGEAADELAPSFVRRVVRHGWLRRWYPDAAGASAVAALEHAVSAAELPTPVTAYTDHALRLEQVTDAFGREGWVWHRGDRVLYARPEPRPEYLSRIPVLMTVIELPADADPRTDAGRALTARILIGQDELATWSLVDGFHSDQAHWRMAIPPSGGDVVKDAIPPHIVLTDLYGDVAGLAVDRGLLRPAADGSHAAAERFLADAGMLLPDIGHLDLIGEYLFNYVYPSPDAKHPELLGNKQAKSNLQQTVWQTCGNVSGGLMHGDCADIAELYQTITAGQGHHPIIIGLPEHAACAWAEQPAGAWNVYVLQTGPPLAFTDAKLPDCLGKAYKSFDPTMSFDPNQVPLLLRFSGEVSRSAWALSWRIFSDPAYCATMIEVQRDWHYQTYQRGIATMEKLIAAGDHDNANYRELAGLASFTGQYDLAVKFHRQAIELTSDPLNRLTMAVELVGFLLKAHHPTEAATVVADILDRQLRELKAGLGDSLPRVGIDLAATCLNEEGGPELRTYAVRALRETAHDQLGQSIDKLSQWLASPQFNRDVWDNSTELRSLRGLLGEYAEVIVALIASGGLDQVPGDEGLRSLATAAQRWLDGIAFHDLEEDSAVMGRYAVAGQWYGAVLGETEFDRLLDAAAMPVNAKIDHAARAGGAWQMHRDVPWVRASVPYWFGRMAKLFRRDRATLDAQEVAHLAQRLAEARDATARLGLADPWSENRAKLAAEIAALVARDEPALRQVLRSIAASNGKELRDDAAQWLGDAARFLPPEWYAKVLKAWVDEVDYKPKYFWIAWRAALNHAPQQALMAAKLAAERYSDDPTFAEEYTFMRRLLSPSGDGTAPQHHEAEHQPAATVP